MSMIRKYHNHKLQTTPWHREEEPLNHHETPGRQIKQSNQLSLPHQDDCNTKMDIKKRTTSPLQSYFIENKARGQRLVNDQPKYDTLLNKMYNCQRLKHLKFL